MSVSLRETPKSNNAKRRRH